MKISSGFLSHSDGENQILVPTGAVKFSGLVRGNSTAGFIISCLEQETDEDTIVEKMRKEWDVSEEIARSDVRRIVMQLREIGAIDDSGSV